MKLSRLSSVVALAGASVLANISGSPITVTKSDTRHLMCRSASARCRSRRSDALNAATRPV